MKKPSYPLRISPTMRRDVEALARAGGLSMNKLISIAIAEKLSRSEHLAWLKKQPALITRSVAQREETTGVTPPDA
jgi:post-segregation antitoxin (ccd killing protein)